MPPPALLRRGAVFLRVGPLDPSWRVPPGELGAGELPDGDDEPDEPEPDDPEPDDPEPDEGLLCSGFDGVVGVLGAGTLGLLSGTSTWTGTTCPVGSLT